MSELPLTIAQKPLNQIAIPGSHDSFTYAITSRSSPSPDGPLFQSFRFFPQFILSTLLRPWTVTQSMNILAQLEAGIRYFDLRVCVRREFTNSPETFEIYLSHGQFANKLGDELSNFVQFLRAHPKEVIILDCNHCYEFKEECHKDYFDAVVLSILEPFMFPYQDEIPSLSDLWDAEAQVIFSSCHKGSGNLSPLFWPISRVHSYWPETVDPDAMITFLNNHISPLFKRSTYTFSVHQGILTPTLSYILLHPGSSIYRLAQKASTYFQKWLNNPKCMAGPNGVNITLIDFLGDVYPSYVKDVIHLNYKTWSSNYSNTSFYSINSKNNNNSRVSR